MAWRNYFSTQPHRRRGEPQLRHSRGAPGGHASGHHRTRQGNPGSLGRRPRRSSKRGTGQPIREHCTGADGSLQLHRRPIRRSSPRFKSLDDDPPRSDERSPSVDRRGQKMTVRKQITMKKAKICSSVVRRGFCALVIVASLLSIRPAWAQSPKGSTAKELNKTDTARAAGDLSQRVDERKNNDETSLGPPADKTLVTGLRFLSSKATTRILLELSQESKYEIRRLKEDPGKGIPPRIYIDILGAKLALTSRDPEPADDGRLRQVRLGQYSADVVRVVLDMQSLGAHNAFLLTDPYRLVIELQGQKGQERVLTSEPAAKVEATASRPMAQAKKPNSTAPAVSNLRKIVLDPGHGGKDPGAIGAGGLAEKDVVLSIAKKLAVKLKNEMGIQVVLTRQDDRFVALEDRTAMANAENADLFISLHMNASLNAEARGIETYYLDNTTDEAAIRLAARENATSRKNISDLQFILSDMMQNMKLEDSITLAHRLQTSLVSGMSKFMGEVKDLGVKKALFHVLVGARMPSILVEMFFITNKNESRAMADANYQDAMVDALFEGIQKYAQSNLMAKTL